MSIAVDLPEVRFTDEQIRDLRRAHFSRRRAIFGLLARGYSESAIAKALRSTQAKVRQDVASHSKVWRDIIGQAEQDHVARELATMDVVERELFQAWDRSKKNRTKLRAGVRGGGSDGTGGSSFSQRDEEGRDGNPRFVSEIIRLVETRGRMLGILNRQEDARTDRSLADLIAESRKAPEEVDALAAEFHASDRSRPAGLAGPELVQEAEDEPTDDEEAAS